MKNRIVLLSIIIFSISCGQVNENKNVFDKEKVSNSVSKANDMNKLDSILVTYWESTEANEYYFKCDKKTIDINSQYFAYSNNVTSQEVVSKFITCINLFYLDKTIPIILSKSTEPPIITDYPVISVQVYKEGKEILTDKIILYSNIRFSPKFLEFNNFLDSLILK